MLAGQLQGKQPALVPSSINNPVPAEHTTLGIIARQLPLVSLDLDTSGFQSKTFRTELIWHVLVNSYFNLTSVNTPIDFWILDSARITKAWLC